MESLCQDSHIWDRPYCADNKNAIFSTSSFLSPQNSIRHNLSLHDMFVRETSANGKISFWTIHPDANRCLTLDQVFKVNASCKENGTAYLVPKCHTKQMHFNLKGKLIFFGISLYVEAKFSCFFWKIDDLCIWRKKEKGAVAFAAGASLGCIHSSGIMPNVQPVSIGLLQTCKEKLSTELDQHFLCCLTRHSQDGIVLSQLEI